MIRYGLVTVRTSYVDLRTRVSAKGQAEVYLSCAFVALFFMMIFIHVLSIALE